MHHDRASSRHWFVTCEKAQHCGALWTARGRFRLRAFILCFYRTAFPIQKSGLKSLAFRSQQLPRISPKSYRHNAVPNRFSISLTSGPRLLSRAKVGTRSAFGKGSHTAAYTPKHRASLLSLHGGLSLISHLGKQKPEEADARLRRVSASPRRRSPAGLRNPVCNLEMLLFCTLCAGHSACMRLGWYHYSRCVSHAVATPGARSPKRLICRFSRPGSHH